MNYYNCCIIFIFSRLYVIFDPICNIVIYFLLVLNFATVICVLSIKVKKKNVTNRIAKASATFGGLRHTVWDRRGITLAIKLKVYNTVVLTTLLYACETWTVYSRHARKLRHFQTTRLRKILKIKWQEKIPDTEVLKRANLPSISALLQRSQLRWAGHLHRLPDYRIPKQLFYGDTRMSSYPLSRL